MLKRESKQKDFFDSYVYERLLPNKHILLGIKESLDFSFVDEAAKDLYSRAMGRGSRQTDTYKEGTRDSLGEE